MSPYRYVFAFAFVCLALLEWRVFFERVLVFAPWSEKPKRWWQVKLRDGVGLDDLVHAVGASIVSAAVFFAALEVKL